MSPQDESEEALQTSQHHESKDQVLSTQCQDGKPEMSQVRGTPVPQAGNKWG